MPDKYEITVSYSGDEVFTGANATSTLTVNQLKSDIKVVGHDINVTDVNGVMFTITLPENANGSLTISNGITLNVTEEGKKETLCHEMVHGMLIHLGYQELSNDEQFVQAFGNAIYQSFTVNQIGCVGEGGAE